MQEHIQHETSTAYTPQQNGMVEREIQSVTQMARTMLLGSGLPKFLWDEAIKTAVFIRNRLPNSIVSTTPYEVATGRKPKVDHLWPFGTEVHITCDWKQLQKFDARTEEGYLVGFTRRSNTYRVYVPDRPDKRITESCNVGFKPHQSNVLMTIDETSALVLAVVIMICTIIDHDHDSSNEVSR